MPFAYGRLPLFRKIFAKDRWMQEHVANYELEADESLYTAAALHWRRPRLVIAYSSDYQGPSPAVKSYYADLLAGRLPYDIVFDAASAATPWWTYPQKIEFLRGRITILKRRA